MKKLKKGAKKVSKKGIVRTDKCKGYKPEDNGCYGSCEDCSNLKIK